MPELKKAAEEIKQFFMPSTANLPTEQQAWVKMDVGEVLAGDVLDMMNDETQNPGAGNMSGSMLAHRIKEWNFTEDDELLPINLANVRRLEKEDLTYLFGLINMTSNSQLNDTEKKT